MIVPMDRIRVMGLRDDLPAALVALQDAGTLHVAPARELPGTQPVAAGEHERRTRRHLERLLGDLRAIDTEVAATPPPAPAVQPAAPLPRLARLARRTRRELVSERERELRLASEAEALRRHLWVIERFDSFLAAAAAERRVTPFLVLMQAGPEAVGAVESAVRQLAGEAFTLRTAAMPDGALAALLLVPTALAPRIEEALARVRVQELPLPRAVAAEPPPRLADALRERLSAATTELAQLRQGRTARLRRDADALRDADRLAHDALAQLAARASTRVLGRLFVLEGWLPSARRDELAALLERRFAGRVTVERIAGEAWHRDGAPVVLANPRLLRPFEVVTRLLPLPRYGSVDPTPLVALFFPLLFGLMLGDVGYGALLGIAAAVGVRRTAAGTTARSVAEVAGACASASVVFGLLYGELFGDLARRVGLRPLLFDREEALLPFLTLTLAVGALHIVVGLALAVVERLPGHPREALGRGTAALMVLLVAAALLAVTGVLPRGLATPFVVALLLAFPVLVFAEGILAPLELLSTLGHVLSYARIMALGTASVMLAVIANRMMGAFGSAVVGVLFGLLFHLVNFAIGLFGPTIHALRLHFVEFFGTFYSPGGTRYQPLRGWDARAG